MQLSDLLLKRPRHLALGDHLASGVSDGDWMVSDLNIQTCCASSSSSHLYVQKLSSHSDKDQCQPGFRDTRERPQRFPCSGAFWTEGCLSCRVYS